MSSAPLRARHSCTSARAASEVIHFDSPSASAVRPSRLGAELDAHPRPAALDAREEAAVEFARLRLQQAALDLDAGRHQLAEALAVDRRVRIAAGGDDAGDAGGDQRVGAGRRAPGVRAGLEGDVGGGAARLVAGLAQRDALPRAARRRARGSPRRRPCPCARSRSRPSGSGLRGVGAALGQAQRARHHRVVGGGELAQAALMRQPSRRARVDAHQVDRRALERGARQRRQPRRA